ncbi:MAG: ROK family protein, partial [Phycisphaerae bacterium]|nr:ROK family protein [Phycisphaerae bacterium]
LGGHFIVNPFGRRCTCGGIGCVETEASEWVLPAIAREHPGFASSLLSRQETINYRAVFQLAEEDELARELRDRSIRVWSAAAVNMIHAFDPEVVILSGGIMKSADVIVPAMQAFIDAHAWVGWGRVRVAAGTLGDTAALLGLGYLAGGSGP